MPLILMSSLAAGLLASTFNFVDSSITLSGAVDYVLAIFIFIVSVDVGASITRGVVSNLGIDALKLATSTLLGSIIVGFLVALLPGVNPIMVLSAAMGMGWYTLAGPLVSASLGAAPGAIAFFSNFVRELFTFLTYPLFASKFGKRNAITLGGATTMDTTLTVISAVGGSKVAAVSFMHGLITTLFVPVLITLILSFAR